MSGKGRQPRRGIVLGGGGVLGAAWMVGALRAVEDVHGFDATTAEVIVGTSAGSVVGTLLAAGVTPRQLRDHQSGLRIESGPLAGYSWDYERATGGNRPPIPRLGPGSTKLLRGSATRLWRMPPTAVLSGFLPQGRGSLDRVGHLVDAITPMGEWSSHPNLWIVAMDYDTGKRVVFGRAGAPAVPLSEAVKASCAIPGWFTPVEIDGHTYVDGGACSATSADLVAHAGLDEVYVLAPMVSFAFDNPGALLAKLERRWRTAVTRRCQHEVAKVRASGTRVTVLGPGPEDLEAMGANVMDVSRRLRVLETSERTSLAALRDPDGAVRGEGPDEAGETAGPGLADAG